jgi:hypothetical protein
MNALDEAREHVEVANSIGTTSWGTEHSLNLAMVKATIELAEQQRIANKLAYLALFPDTELARQFRREFEVAP